MLCILFIFIFVFTRVTQPLQYFLNLQANFILLCNFRKLNSCLKKICIILCEDVNCNSNFIKFVAHFILKCQTICILVNKEDCIKPKIGI